MKYGLGFLKHSQEQLIIENINLIIKSWCNNWLSYTCEPILSFRYFNHLDQSTLISKGMTCLDSNNSIGFINLEKEDWSKIYFGDNSTHIPFDSVFDYLCETATVELLNEILQKFNKDICSDKLIVKKYIETDSVVLIVELIIESIILELIIDVDFLFSDTLNYSFDGVLEKRLNSILEIKTDLTISFPFVHTNLASLIGLQSGDVIKTEQLISEPLNFVINEKLSMSCSLGTKDNFLAIQLFSKVF